MSSVSLGAINSQEKLKTMLMQSFGATIKKHYGMLWYLLEWPIIITIFPLFQLVHRELTTTQRGLTVPVCHQLFFLFYGHSSFCYDLYYNVIPKSYFSFNIYGNDQLINQSINQPTNQLSNQPINRPMCTQLVR